MALPLPKVVADVGPGGGLVTSMMGTNALTASNLENEINKVKAKYAPLTTQAEAASKLAYANLMGPQFLAKMLGNPDIAANLSDPQLKNAIGTTYGAATGQGTGNAMMRNMPQQGGMQDPLQNPIMALIAKGIQSLRGQGGQQQGGQPQGNNFLNSPVMSPQDRQAVNQLQPGQSYQIQGNQPQGSGAVMRDDGSVQPQPMRTTPNPNISFDQNGQPVLKDENAGQSYFEKAGTQAGIKEELKELGGQRAKAIGDLDEQYQQAIQAEVPVQHLMDMTQNPVFMNMRNKIPFFQDKQLNILAKTGTPEEQKLIGDFITTTMNAVANTVNSFGGRALVKEFDVADRMKISPNDTWNVMVGKLGSIGTFNEMTKQRARIASQLMQKEHINRGDAMQRADKMVDGAAIRKSIENKLNPKPTDEDVNYMAQKYNISPDEVKKRLKAKGKL
jgi:hypothetical protein